MSFSLCAYCGIALNDPRAKQACASLKSPSGFHMFSEPELKGINVEELRDVLCCVSQIFNGWRPAEEWSKWDEEVAQRVVMLQRQLEKEGN